MAKRFKIELGTFVEILLSTAVAMLVVRIVGSVLGALSLRPMNWIFAHSNSLLELAGTVVNLLSVFCAFAILYWASSNEQISLFRRNRRLLSVAGTITLVLGAQVVLQFLGSQVQWLLIVPVGNVTQVDFTSYLGFVTLGIVLPALGLFLLLVFNSRRLKHVESQTAV